MTDMDANRRLFLGVYDDRVVTFADLLMLEEEASGKFYGMAPGWKAETPLDISATTLMFGIQTWRTMRRPNLFWPIAPQGSDAFSFNLLWQMSEHDPEGPYALLRKLPLARARPSGGEPGDDVGMAFAAGLIAGLLDPTDVRMRSFVKARAQANEMLLGFTQVRKTAAEDRRARLLAFARAMIADDPHATTAEIARAFRAKHRPKAAASTDLEETEIRAWRKSGELPARVFRKIARDS